LTCFIAIFVLVGMASAQRPATSPAPETKPAAAPTTPLLPPTGTVLFSTENGAPRAANAPAASSSSQSDDLAEPGPPDVRPAVLVTNAERSAVAIAAYRLDVHLIPARAREEVHADLTIRNTSSTPMARIPRPRPHHTACNRWR
jgi:hypothetical protein